MFDEFDEKIKQPSKSNEKNGDGSIYSFHGW
jgi:hypothetical protein